MPRESLLQSRARGSRTQVALARHFRFSAIVSWILVVSLILPGAKGAAGQAQDHPSTLFEVGETLQYKVSWKFIRLGTITICVLPDSTDPQASGHRVSMTVESNPNLRFVSIHEYNESLIDPKTLMTKVFQARYRNRNRRHAIRHYYDEIGGQAYYRSWDLKSRKVFREHVIADAVPYVDGPSLFFISRARSQSGAVLQLPTMIAGKIEITTLDFTGPIETVEIKAWDTPIRVRKYEGIADWKGGTSQGISGRFRGWVSDDAAAVPVRAEMKVILGSVVLELENWHRPGWKPPQSRDDSLAVKTR